MTYLHLALYFKLGAQVARRKKKSISTVVRRINNTYIVQSIYNQRSINRLGNTDDCCYDYCVTIQPRSTLYNIEVGRG